MKKTIFSILALFMCLVAYGQQQGVMVADTDAKLITSASQISSPNTEPSEGSIEAMLDGDPGTFWHSTWTDGDVTPGTHYFEVEVSNVPELFAITFTRRWATNDQITRWGIYGAPNSTADKSACTLLGAWDTPVASQNETLVSPVYESKGFNRLRFYCENTTGDGSGTRGYFHLAEFQILGTKEVLIKGDLNNDGSISIADVTSLVNVVLGKSPIETITLSSNSSESGGSESTTSPFAVDNSLVVGTWYAPDGTHFNLNEDGTTDFPGGATYEFYPSQGRLLILNSSGLAHRIIPLVKVTSAYLLAVNYLTETFTYYTNSASLVTGLAMSETSLAMNSGTTAQLSVSATPADAFNPHVTWSSSDESIATVDQDGLVTALMGGTVTITATATDGSGQSAVCTVTITQMVTGITLSETSLALALDGYKKLTAIISPSNATNQRVTWSSNDDNVAEVTSAGGVAAVGRGTCIITCTAQDGSGVTATCMVYVHSDDDYVDLGLPSGTLWATMNVGATSPEDYGDYFAWGETEGDYSGKILFDWSTYKWCNGSEKTMAKYCIDSNYGYNGFTDNKTELDPEDDAAYVNWGSGWRMPSEAQYDELINSSYTTTEYTTQNGVNGRKITSKTNGNSIFLPAADNCVGSAAPMLSRGNGTYWSRTLYSDDPNYAWYLGFGSSSVYMSAYRRDCGLSVRPVRVSQ